MPKLSKMPKVTESLRSALSVNRQLLAQDYEKSDSSFCGAFCALIKFIKYLKPKLSGLQVLASGSGGRKARTLRCVA
jgi:hypothetical protein